LSFDGSDTLFSLNAGSGDLEFTQITLAGDMASVTLTWRSKLRKKYAVDVSYDLVEDSWIELSEEIDSGGIETTAIVPTYSGVETPNPLPGRAYFRVRERLLQ
jgi:hypothetical protein